MQGFGILHTTANRRLDYKPCAKEIDLIGTTNSYGPTDWVIGYMNELGVSELSPGIWMSSPPITYSHSGNALLCLKSWRCDIIGHFVLQNLIMINIKRRAELGHQTLVEIQYYATLILVLGCKTSYDQIY